MSKNVKELPKAKELAQANFDALIIKINNAIDNPTPEVKIDELKASLVTALETLNSEIKAEEFANILGCNTPALEACKRGTITLSKIKTDNDTKKVSEGSKDEIIDLAEIQLLKPTEKITVDPMWAVYSEALNHAILNYNMEIQGITEKSKRLAKFKMSGGAAMLNITTSEMSTTDGIKKAIQRVIDTIISDCIVTDKNAMQFLLNYTKVGAAINGVSMPTEGTFRRLLMRILYQIVNNSTLIAE